MTNDDRVDGNFLKVAIIIITGLAVFYLSLTPVKGGDFWMHAKIGSIILGTGHIPETLTFPFTEMASQRFNAHEWLSEIIYAVALDGVGQEGLIYFAGVAGLMLWAVLVGLAWRNTSGNLAVALSCGYLAMVLENYRHVLRPELLSLYATGLFWILLEAYVHSPRRWHLPAISLVVVAWANLHGSFPLAILMTLIYTLAFAIDSWRSHRSFAALGKGLPAKLLALSALVTLSTCVNPFGVDLLRFAFQFGTYNEVHKYISEWLPTLSTRWFSTPWFWVILGAWVLILAAVISSRKSLRTVDFLLVAFFTLLAVKAIRFPIYLIFPLAFYLPKALVQWLARAGVEARGVYIALGTGAAALTWVFSTWGNTMGYRPLIELDIAKVSPPMERLLADPAIQGNVLNSMELGAELIYRGFPRLRPAMDGRVDSYGLEYYAFVGNTVYKTAYFHDFINKYDVKYIFLTRESFDGFRQLPYWKNGEWKLMLADRNAAFLVRSNADVAPLR